MRISNSNEQCQVCGKNPSVIFCDGCGRPLCLSCRKFDMWQEDCGSIHTKVFCEQCASNPWINPYGGKMD